MIHPALERTLLDLRAQHREMTIRRCEESLFEFVRTFWHIVEPSNPLIEGWVMEAICQHLQAVSEDEIQRAIVNVPPGCSKSLLSCVFFPAWEWGPRNMPSMRYAAFSYTSTLTERDNWRLLQLIQSPLYRDYWGDRFSISGGKIKILTDATGWKLATSISGVGTGERADRLLLDDLNNVKESESRAILDSTNQWIREVMPTRLNHLDRSAIIAIQQRTAEDDCTGTLVSGRDDWTWLMIPMCFEPDRHCTTSIGWTDPRTEEGDLCWPERFSPAAVKALEREMGDYAWHGQMQQSPKPRGGGIIKDEWWQQWASPHPPPLDFCIASLDTALTEKESSDYSALTIWGSFQAAGNVIGGELRDYQFVANNETEDTFAGAAGRERMDMVAASLPKILMLHGWKDRLSLPALTERVLASCLRFRVDVLVIENKANGWAVNQTLREHFSAKPFGIHMFEPRRYGDKSARLYGVQHLFSEGMIFAPGEFDENDTWAWKKWAQAVIDNVSQFPRGKNDDLTDTVSMALWFLRQRGFAPRKEDAVARILDRSTHKGRRQALYPT
jgi:predicted phage terminase large subunit-like protein